MRVGGGGGRDRAGAMVETQRRVDMVNLYVTFFN